MDENRTLGFKTTVASATAAVAAKQIPKSFVNVMVRPCPPFVLRNKVTDKSHHDGDAGGDSAPLGFLNVKPSLISCSPLLLVAISR